MMNKVIYINILVEVAELVELLLVVLKQYYYYNYHHHHYYHHHYYDYTTATVY